MTKEEKTELLKSHVQFMAKCSERWDDKHFKELCEIELPALVSLLEDLK